MAAIEIYKGVGQVGGYATIATEIFQLAGFLSSSSHINIIDSYSGARGRYKGDPIANNIWITAADTLGQNDWFVVECQTELPALAAMGYTGLPKWQAKFQFCGSLNYLADPSDPTGVKYPKNHNIRRLGVVRFAPYGGWDLEDSLPDFNPASPPASGHVSTQNHKHGSSTNTFKWLLILADGVFTRLGLRDSAGIKQVINCPGILGDVTPAKKEYMPMPRCAYGNGYANSGLYVATPPAASILSESGAITNGGLDYETTDSLDGGIAFWDNDEELIESAYTQPDGYQLNWAMINVYSAIPGVDMLPFIPIPAKAKQHVYFSYPYLRRGQMPGQMLISNKQWLCVGHGYGALFRWDGVTSTIF